MTNFLEGIQYREKKAEIPTWNVDPYGEWQDADSTLTYNSGVEFRVKPSHTYVLDVADKPDLVTGSKDTAMSRVAKLIDEGCAVSIQRQTRATVTVSQLLASRNIQFKTTGQDSWASGTYFNNGRAGLIVFRVRPDHYWEVLISSGITSAKLSFDDVEAVNTYVTKQLRTSDSRMVINKVRYE